VSARAGSLQPVKRLVLVALAAGLAAAAAPADAAAQGGRPDPTFGDGRGWVTTRIAGGAPVAYSAAIARGGKIVVAGQATTRGGAGQIFVVRYRRDGRLDRGFGARGIFKSALPKAAGPFIATDIAQERRTGRLLVAGGYGQGSLLVLRLTPAGRLDRSFGRSGLARARAGGIAQSLTLQKNGGILVGGSNANQNGRPMVVARFTRNGVLDRGFGTRGLAQVLFWDADLAASAGVDRLATTTGGAIIGFGHLDYIGSDGHGSAGVFQLTSRGQPALGFGNGGHVEVAFTRPSGGFEQWFPCAMTLVSGGRIMVAGDGSAGSGGAILSTRLTPQGTSDSSYGGDGLVVTPGLRSFNDTTCGATSNAAGALTVGVGASLAQLQADGTPNDRFARGGIIRIARPRGVGVNAVVRAGSRRVVLAGFARNALYVARYRLPAQP
jgi:uncharacterized delta-60 repeat protein